MRRFDATRIERDIGACYDSIERGLEPVCDWETVAELANDLLAASPHHDWTVTVRAQAGVPTARRCPGRWAYAADPDALRFEVVVPANRPD